jgi:ElaB/YqjD/DUF883 family membrane-anchored ribosome-binding protein
MDIRQPVKDATSTAKKSIDSAAGQLQGVANSAAAGARGVSGNFSRAVNKSLKNDPYMSLAMAAAVGFVLGAIWRA